MRRGDSFGSGTVPTSWDLGGRASVGARGATAKIQPLVEVPRLPKPVAPRDPCRRSFSLTS